MNNKDTKKQPSAQALSDDDLENVSGGYRIIYNGDYNEKSLGFLPEEEAYLKDLGISYERYINPRSPVSLGFHLFKDADGNSLSPDQVVKILRDGGFRYG